MKTIEVNKLIEVSNLLSFLRGFLSGYGGEEPIDTFPFECKDINEVYDLEERTEKKYNELALKFKLWQH